MCALTPLTKRRLEAITSASKAQFFFGFYLLLPVLLPSLLSGACVYVTQYQGERVCVCVCVCARAPVCVCVEALDVSIGSSIAGLPLT